MFRSDETVGRTTFSKPHGTSQDSKKTLKGAVRKLDVYMLICPALTKGSLHQARDIWRA